MLNLDVTLWVVKSIRRLILASCKRDRQVLGCWDGITLLLLALLTDHDSKCATNWSIIKGICLLDYAVQMLFGMSIHLTGRFCHSNRCTFVIRQCSRERAATWYIHAVCTALTRVHGPVSLRMSMPPSYTCQTGQSSEVDTVLSCCIFLSIGNFVHLYLKH